MFELFIDLLNFGVAMIFVVIPCIIFYVLTSFSYYKALKRLNYAKAWMAWIPYLNYYAFADCICLSEYVEIFGYRIQTSLFKFWILLDVAVSFIPWVGFILSVILQAICLGYCFTHIYASLEQKSTEETQAIGVLSGIFPIIAVVKFLIIK